MLKASQWNENESEIRASEGDTRIRARVSLYTCRKQTYCPQGGSRGTGHPPRGTGPTGNRRICLRFIPNRNWWLSLALLGSLFGARREEPTDFQVGKATPSLLWFCIIGRARSRIFDLIIYSDTDRPVRRTVIIECVIVALKEHIYERHAYLMQKKLQLKAIFISAQFYF